MPKWSFLLLAGCIWQATPALAQPSDGAQPILYRADVPKNVAHAMPRQSKRWFWGTVTPSPGSQPIGLQIYESGQGLQLQLWQKKSKSFLKINGIPNLFEKPYESSVKFNVQLFWLNRKQKIAPVLVISQVSYENLMPGIYKLIQVVALPEGWKGKSSAQTFVDGASNSGDDDFSVGYDGAEKLELTTVSTDIGGSTKETYDWDGKQFSSVPEKRVTTPSE